MIVVTGGAGFIGSALIHGLNKNGIKQIWVVDQIDHPEKQENLIPLLFDKLIDKDDFLNNIRIIIHKLIKLRYISNTGFKISSKV